MLPPVSPSWPQALVDSHAEFQRLHARWREESKGEQQKAIERLEAIEKAVQAKHPDLRIYTQLFEFGNRVGIGARHVNGRAHAVYRPVEGFDEIECESAIGECLAHWARGDRLGVA